MTVAIVGAGIIGLYLAWKLAERGHKITVFEKKKELGGKVCSALISERLKDFIPIGESLIENKIHFCRIHFPKKTVTLKLQPVHLVINRQKLIQQLFALCEKSGVEIRFNDEVKEIPQGFERVIGCDGALSVIRKQLGLAKPLLRLGLQLFDEKNDYGNYVETWPIKQGFCWKIPRGERIEYGALGPPATIKQSFEKFLRTSYNPVGDFVSSGVKGGLVPQGLVLPESNNTTLCGDAAGLTKPWSGGGLIWGLHAAEILLKTFPNFSQYHSETRQFFWPRIFKAKLTIPLVYFLGEYWPFLIPSHLTIDNDFLVQST